jgi:exosortase
MNPSPVTSPDPPAQRGSKTENAAWILLGLALLGVYAPHVAYMAVNWWNDPNYSHGFLVPLVTAYLLWRNRENLARAAGRPNAWGLAVIGFGLVLLVLGQVGHEFFLRRFSLIPVLWGLALTAWGWTLARRTWFPAVYLILMIPLPYVVYDSVAFPLRLVAASFAGWVLRLTGLPVLVEGNIIHLPNAVLDVVDACSGIRSLVSLLAVGLLLAHFVTPRLWQKTLLMLLVPPVAVFTNSLRVVSAGLMAESIGPQMLEGTVHDLTGWVVFMAAFALLAFLAWLMRRFTPGAPGDGEVSNES